MATTNGNEPTMTVNVGISTNITVNPRNGMETINIDTEGTNVRVGVGCRQIRFTRPEAAQYAAQLRAAVQSARAASERKAKTPAKSLYRGKSMKLTGGNNALARAVPYGTSYQITLASSQGGRTIPVAAAEKLAEAFELASGAKLADTAARMQVEVAEQINSLAALSGELGGIVQAARQALSRAQTLPAMAKALTAPAEGAATVAAAKKGGAKKASSKKSGAKADAARGGK